MLRPQSEWRAAIGGELGAIVANPPWEKLKVLRHEHEIAAGVDRHYGAAHTDEPSADLHDERMRVRQYAEAIITRYPLAGRGETDLFVAFTQSSTFGPTDAPLLARWAKVLAMIQIFISLSIVVLLISAAVGAL